MYQFGAMSVRKLSTSAFTSIRPGKLQRKCACGGSSNLSGECEECRKKNQGTLQRSTAHGGQLNAVPSTVHDVLRASGQPLSEATRAFMEPRFGHDFSGVRVHVDERASESARAVNALAYTVGQHIVFGAGHYAPYSRGGQKLIAHELTHTIQQQNSSSVSWPLRIASPHDACEQEAGHASTALMSGQLFRPVLSRGPQIARQTPSPTHSIDADELPTNPYEESPGEKQAAEFARMTISVVKDPILQALRHHDSVNFLNRLREVEPSDRRLLEVDQPFLDEIRHYLSGLAFWTVRLILHFGNNRPANVRRLYLAVSDRNIQLVKDLLRGFAELRDEVQTPGVAEMLNYELRGTPAHDEVLRLLAEQELAGRHSLLSSYQEAHYETKSGFAGLFGASELRSFTGTTAYTLARTGTELRVIVRIHLVKAGNASETYYPSDVLANRWRTGIEGVWNNHFYAWNGTTQLTIVFVPIFTDESPDHTVQVAPGDDRSDEKKWYEEDSGITIAHEFGHMIGNPDEYRLPGTAAEIPASMGLSSEDVKRSNVEGITGQPGSSDTTLSGSIMGSDSGKALPRHVWPILEFYNRSMKPASEKDYKLL
jgi:hypothetical protein